MLHFKSSHGIVQSSVQHDHQQLDKLVLLSRELGVIGLHVTAANIGLSHRNLLLVLLLLLVALGALEVWQEEQIRTAAAKEDDLEPFPHLGKHVGSD